MPQQPTPHVVFIRETYPQQITTRSRALQEADQRMPGQVLAPAHRCATDDSSGVGISAHQLPEKAQPGRLQLPDFLVGWIAAVDQVDLRIVGEDALPVIVVLFA